MSAFTLGRRYSCFFNPIFIDNSLYHEGSFSHICLYTPCVTRGYHWIAYLSFFCETNRCCPCYCWHTYWQLTYTSPMLPLQFISCCILWTLVVWGCAQVMVQTDAGWRRQPSHVRKCIDKSDYITGLSCYQHNASISQTRLLGNGQCRHQVLTRNNTCRIEKISLVLLHPFLTSVMSTTLW